MHWQKHCLMMFWYTYLETRKELVDALTFVFRSYSECCIDDVTASHATRNDMIVKFGHACFTTKETQIKAISKADETYTKQVLYVVP